MNSDQQDFFAHAKHYPLSLSAGIRTREVGCQAPKAGGEVKRLLSSPPLSGKVLAHLPGNLYFLTDHKDLFWGSTAAFPMHRRCLQVPSLPPSHLVRPGQRFRLRPSALCIGDSFFIDLRSFTEWAPPSVFTKKPHPLADLWPRCQTLNTYINCLESPKGLGRVIPLIFAMAEGGEVSSSAVSFLRQLLTPVLEVAKACRQRDLRAALAEGEGLVGLGPGLTPSGDDFLGGLLFLIHSLNSAYPGIFPWDQERVTDFIKRAKYQTHPLSHAFLNDFAWGHAPAPLHELVNALIYSDRPEGIFSPAVSCLTFGHSSGWDVLAGLLTGMLMV